MTRGLAAYQRVGQAISSSLKVLIDPRMIAAATGCERAGVVTRSTERRAELARDTLGVTAYDSLADLAAAGVDAVVISTPLHTHPPWSAKPSG